MAYTTSYLYLTKLYRACFMVWFLLHKRYFFTKGAISSACV